MDSPVLSRSGTQSPRTGSKISDLIALKESRKEVHYSFEFFPPKTEQGVTNLYHRFDVMARYSPLFIDVTWGAGGRTSDLTLELCINASKFCGLEPQMHLTCTNMPKEKIDHALKECKEANIRNILALRGDPPQGEEWQQIEGGFAHAVDLVKYIRAQYGDFFCIGVAGYPEKHVDAPSYQEDLQRLKEKVDAGADLIVSQLFYDVHVFLKFVEDCRKIGIKVPILPGLMPIGSYQGMMRMCSLCGATVPDKIKADLEPVKDDDKAVQDYGVNHCIDMCKELIKNGILSLHFYTLNQEKSVKRILLGLGLIKEDTINRPLPWSAPRNHKKEDVRPIFWANRPKTYIARTEEWDAFPNGRWGDSGSPAFSLLDLYHTSQLYTNSRDTRLKEWGSPKSIEDVAAVFLKYLDGKISSLPWNDTQLQPEANVISAELKLLNQNQYFTINSQPRVNALPSDHRIHGWGPVGGIVWQKAYIEFFCSPAKVNQLIDLLPKYKTLSIQAVNKAGDHKGNVALTDVSAVTWGVWPGSQIKQPTIVDPAIFRDVWKDEAFELWSCQWGELYPHDSPSYAVIKEIAETFYLVNIVDNDFINGNIFSIFHEAIGK